MNMKHLKMRALLLALAGCSCVALAAPGQPVSGTQPEPTPSPSVISGLLREQLSRRNPAASATITTSTTQSARLVSSPAASQPQQQPAIETEVPSSLPTSPTTQKPQPSITTSTTTSREQQQPSSPQFQVLRPQTAAPPVQKLSTLELTTAAPITTTTTTSTPTTTTEQPRRDPPACLHNNQTYQIGQKWNEDCMLTCECVLNQREFEVPLAISACRPRCPTPIDPPGASCRLERSSKDSCCLEWHCELEAKYAPTSPVAPTTLITTTQTERGQLNMSTTEIRMPPPASSSPLPPTTLAATTTTTTPVPTTLAATTSSKPITTTASAATLTPSRRTRPPATVTTVRSSAAPVTTTLASTSTSKPSSSAAPRRTASQQASVGGGTTASLSAREPRQGDFGSPPAARRPTSAFGDFSSMTRDIGADPSAAPLEEGAISDIEQPEAGIEPAREVEPSLVDLCIVGEDEGYEMNRTFSIGECPRLCKCVFRDEPQDKINEVYIHQTVNLQNSTGKVRPTEIRCGWPKRCAVESLVKQLKPSAECAEPVLVRPRDECDCPTVTCPSAQPPKQQPRVQSLKPETKMKKQGCKSHNHPSGKLAPGESFTDECHSICVCSEEGQFSCKPLVCPTEPPSDPLCAEWELNPSFKQNTSFGLCCADFVCKREALKVPATSLSPAPVTSSTPQITTVTSTMATTSQPDDEEPESKMVPAKSCFLMGRLLGDGESVPKEIQESPQDDNCERPACVCKDGNIVCPQAVCPTNFGSLDRVNVTLVNGTTVELLIDLPKSLIGHFGHFELNYTHTPVDAVTESPEAEPPAEAVWRQRPKIRTADESFSADRIKYFWPELVPGHKYWFQLTLIYEGPLRIFVSPLRSPIQSMVIPSEVPSATSTGMSSATDSLDSSASSTSMNSLSSSTPAPTTTTTTITTTTTTTARPAPTRVLQPVKPTSGQRASQRPHLATTTIAATTTTTTTTAEPYEPEEKKAPFSEEGEKIIPKPPVGQLDQTSAPCAKETPNSQSAEEPVSPMDPEVAQPSATPLSWHLKMKNDVHAAIQRNAWHLLVAFFVMTTLFVIVLYSYCKKVRVVAPITTPGHHHNGFAHHPHHHHQSAYDNPTFTKLVSYYGNQPHVLLVDESNQNFDNMAKQKNLEVDKSSPLHNSNNNNNGSTPNNNHHTTPVQHRNGRQNLI